MVDAKIPRLESSQSDSRENSISHPPTVTPLHAFHVIKKYKVIISEHNIPKFYEIFYLFMSIEN